MMPSNGKSQTLVQVPGQGMCRNCLFSLKDEISLARLGLADHVRLRHAGPELGAGWGFAAKLWTAIVVWDSLFQLRAYYRPMTVDTSEVDQLYTTLNDELEELLQRPYSNGAAGLAAFVQAAKTLRRLVERISLAFAGLAKRAPPSQTLRRVLLSGDVYLRLDEMASGGLIHQLNQRDLAVIVEPLSLLAEYMAEERLGELVGLPTQRGANLILKRGMAVLRHAVQTRLRRLHPWLPATDLKALLAASRTVLDRHPFGEAPITIGSVLHHWETRSCDGVVAISPWGCGPALVSESLLRHFDEIPLLFVYVDGTPLDERKLDAFAFQLQRRTMR